MDEMEPSYQVLPVPFAAVVDTDHVDCIVQGGARDLGEGRPSAICEHDAGRIIVVHNALELVFEVE